MKEERAAVVIVCHEIELLGRLKREAEVYHERVLDLVKDFALSFCVLYLALGCDD
jgi:hypothetical protein